AHARLVADGRREGLPQRDADVFDRVVIVDVGVAVAMDVEVDETMTRDLVEPVIEEGHAGIDALAAGAVDVDGHANAGFLGVAGYSGSTHVRLGCGGSEGGIRRWRRVPADLRRVQGRRRLGPAFVRPPATP